MRRIERPRFEASAAAADADAAVADAAVADSIRPVRRGSSRLVAISERAAQPRWQP